VRTERSFSGVGPGNAQLLALHSPATEMSMYYLGPLTKYCIGSYL